MSEVKKLAGQTLIYGISSILGRVLNFLLTPIHTNYFVQATYGIISYLYAYTAFINVLLTFGMETTFFRFLQDNQDPNKLYHQAFSWVLTLSISFFTLIFLFRDMIAQWIGYPQYGHIIVLIGAIIALDALAALPMAKLRYQERAKLFMLINLINITITVLLNIYFIYAIKGDVTYVFIANLIASIIKTILAIAINPPRYLLYNSALLKPMLQYGGFIMLAGIAGTINEMLDRIMLKWLWDEDQLFQGVLLSGEEMTGIYGANYKFAMLISLFTQAFKYAAEPFFFKSAADKDSPERFAKVFHLYTLATLVGFLVLSSFASEIVSIDLTLGLRETPIYLIGETYWGGLNVVPVLLLAYVFNGAYFNLSIWFKISKQTQYALIFTSMGAGITITANWLGIPHFGYMASAWATFLSFAVMAVAVYLIGSYRYPIPYRIKRISLYTFIFGIAVLINSEMLSSYQPINEIFIKTAVCVLALISILLLERFFPLFGSKDQLKPN